MQRLERIRSCADISIRRGCGFALLAIWTMMVGASWDAEMAARTGAGLITVMWAVLMLKAVRAPRANYRRTEVWILLDKQHDLPEQTAQTVIGGILKDRFLWHADVTGIVALVLWAVVLWFQLFR